MIKIGYFSTSQQITFGKNKSGNIIYKITVFNESNSYLVPYGGKLKGKIIILFKNNSIIDVIGLMNNNNLIITLQYIYNIFKKNILLDLYINPLEKNINRIFIDNNIFSIDPYETEDIDDALSFEEDNNYYIIGVYIAQPIYYLTQELLENYSQKVFSTLYNDKYKKNNNLWGDIITNNTSLYPNKTRPVYAIIYYLNKDYTINKIIHFPGMITNKIRTNYDKCLKYDNINQLYLLTKKLENINDTHELVSYWMIKTNNYLGLNTNLKLPNRVIIKNIDTLIYDDTIKDIFINNSAYYSLEENYHEILNKFSYIHFTSPIRRIMDTINHWCITYNINFTDLNIDINNINKFDKLTKKYHNNIKLLKAIEELENENILNGWIYKNNWQDCLEKKNCIKITVYFKELGFQKVELWNKKFNYLLDESWVNNIKVGDKYEFTIYKKEGFLPKEKILIKIK